MGRTLQLGTAFGLMGCLWHGVCQPGFLDAPRRNAPDPTIYDSFFRQVAQLKNASGPILLNGQASNLTQPSAQDAIGLTDQESQALNAVASDCEAKIYLLDVAVRPLIFEQRLRQIQSESTPPWLIQQLKNLANERNQTVWVHIQQLKAAFGDSRFSLLDAYVSSRKSAASFFPLVPARN